MPQGARTTEPCVIHNYLPLHLLSRVKYFDVRHFHLALAIGEIATVIAIVTTPRLVGSESRCGSVDLAAALIEEEENVYELSHLRRSAPLRSRFQHDALRSRQRR